MLRYTVIGTEMTSRTSQEAVADAVYMHRLPLRICGIYFPLACTAQNAF